MYAVSCTFTIIMQSRIVTAALEMEALCAEYCPHVNDLSLLSQSHPVLLLAERGSYRTTKRKRSLLQLPSVASAL